jgi:hypothetical protein
VVQPASSATARESAAALAITNWALEGRRFMPTQKRVIAKRLTTKW